MPWYIAESKKCPASKPWAVIKKDGGKVVGCHESKERAGAHLRALNANVKEMSEDDGVQDD